MSSGREKKEIIKDGIRLTKSSTSETAEKSLAMLYTLADKFLEEKDLKEIKEVLAMTRIGQMLYEDGCEKTKIETAQTMHSLNYGDQAIADVLKVGIEKVREWLYGTEELAK